MLSPFIIACVSMISGLPNCYWITNYRLILGKDEFFLSRQSLAACFGWGRDSKDQSWNFSLKSSFQQSTFLVLFYFLNFINVFVCGCFACMNIYAPCVCLVLREAEDGNGVPGTGVTDSYTPPRGCWKSHRVLCK